MGLDVVAYEKAVLEPGPDDPDDERYETAFCYEGMERSLRGLQAGGRYRVGGEKLHFRAGPYGSYNDFREALCRAALGIAPEMVWADPDSYAGRPFYELIHFADNEGTIGPEAAADLAADFAEGVDTVRPKLDEYHQNSYDRWRQAFELAAGSGMVVFT